jgi:hypothetical protein
MNWSIILWPAYSTFVLPTVHKDGAINDYASGRRDLEGVRVYIGSHEPRESDRRPQAHGGAWVGVICGNFTGNSDRVSL